MIHSIARLLVERGRRRRPAKRTLLQAALCLCACSLIAMRASQAQPSSLDLTSPAISSGTYTYSATGDIRAETAFTVSGSGSVTFRAGQSIHLEPGFHATAGSGAYFHAVIGTATSGPVITNLTPSSGPIGQLVTLTGSNFGSGGMATFFNGVQASYTSNGSTINNLPVPNGTATGPVFVTPTGGIASNAVNFTVTAGSSMTTREYIRLGGRVIAIEIH
jgi:hypothetical protein